MQQQTVQEPGARQLRDWMKRRGFESQADMARFLGIDQRFVSQYLNSEAQPGLKHALVIERKSGIPVESWMTSELDDSEDTAKSRAKKANIRNV
jgi:transcriptional regulator with XRE-family HTH domain